MSQRISHQGAKARRNTKGSVGADLRVRPSHIPWNSIKEKLENDYKVYLLVDNIPVTLSLTLSFETYTLHVRPEINGHYVPDFVEPHWEHQEFHYAMDEILDRFYYRRQHLTEQGKKNKKLKKKSQFDVIIYYTSFPNFKSFKKHYEVNFFEIILLAPPAPPAPNSLPADLSQALPQPQTKALNPGNDKGEVNA